MYTSYSLPFPACPSTCFFSLIPSANQYCWCCQECLLLTKAAPSLQQVPIHCWQLGYKPLSSVKLPALLKSAGVKHSAHSCCSEKNKRTFMFSATNLSAIDKLHHFGAKLVKLPSVPALGIEHIHLGPLAHPGWLGAHQHPSPCPWGAGAACLQCLICASSSGQLMPCLWNTDVPLQCRGRAGADLSKSWLDTQQVSSLNLREKDLHF